MPSGDILAIEFGKSSQASKHAPKASYDTNASGFANSTISNGESLRLSQFPSPPLSIPATPISSRFGLSSSSGGGNSPRGTLQIQQCKGTASALGVSSLYTEPIVSHKSTAYPVPTEPHQVYTSYAPSPHDWHDGTSNIAVGTTEGQMLPTSVITSLLQQNAATSAEHASRNSDAGVASYPPPAPDFRDSRVSSSNTSTLQWLGHLFPSASTPIQEPPNNQVSADLEKSHLPQDGSITAASFSSAFHPMDGYTVHSTHAVPSRDPVSQPVAASDETAPEGSIAQGWESIYSIEDSVAPSRMSRLFASPPVRRVLTWKRGRPLPPVPLLDNTSIMVDNGHHSHRKRYSRIVTQKQEESTSASITMGQEMSTGRLERNTKPRRCFGSQWRWFFGAVVKKWSLLAQHKKRTSALLLVALIAIGTTVALSTRRRDVLLTCPGGFVGAGCELNATCVCTSTLPGRCDGLAQNILDLIPTLNQRFIANMTGNMVYNGIWLAQGAAPGSNCTSQALSVDVSPALDSRTLPNVTQWAQTALLWNLIESQDVQTVVKLRNFIQKAPWDTYGQSVEKASSFSVLVSGYMFDFATQEITPPSISFLTQSQPTSAQLAQVGPVAHSALDRMYSFAIASSTQHKKALANYWTTTLQQQLADLPIFVSTLSASPILLPFDATSSLQPVGSLLTAPAPSTFPPPLGCYPGLNSAQKELINSIEGPVFGLTPILDTTHFEPACYPDRPVYGVLDILRLRLPFIDSRTDVARQAAILKRDAVPRVLVHSGETLSPLPGASNMTTISAIQSDPRRYGTLGDFDHVVLKYLTSIPDVNVATALVHYILGSAPTLSAPPTNASILYQSLPMLPAMEVAVFGSIAPSDIDSVVSAFTTTSGSLFFGSDHGSALRNWAIMGCNSTIVWSETALSPLVVRDHDLSDPVFNQTWIAVSTALHNNIPGIGIANITETFDLTHKFSAS